MALVTAIVLALLLLGTYLLSRGIYVWDAALVIALALGGYLLVVLRSRSRRGTLLAHLGSLLPRKAAGWVRSVALVLSAGIALGARTRSLDAGFAHLFVLWVGAVVAFVSVTGGQLLIRQPLRLAHRRAEGLIVVLLLLSAGLARAVAVGRIPTNLGGDEGTQLADALALVAAPMGNPFATGWYSVPTMSFLAYGMSMKVFGATVAGGRALSVTIGTATVATTYLLARSLSGRRVAELAASFVAFSAYHIHFSRLASNQIADPLIGTLTLWLVWQGLHAAEEGRETVAGGTSGEAPQPAVRTLYWGLAGVVAGFGWYAYFGARWVTILVMLVVGWQTAFAHRFWARHWRGLLFFAFGWLLVALPLLGWYSVHPSPLTERYNAVSIFASGWLARETQITGRGPVALLLQQFGRSAAAFHLTQDPTFWYFPQRPLLDFITGSLVLVGVIDAILRWRWPSRSLVLLWFWSTLVMAWVLTENPPSSQRGLLMVPAVAIFAAWGAASVGRGLLGHTVPSVWWRGGLIVLIAVANCLFYFAIYTPTRLYGNPTAEIATAFSRYTLANPEPVCGSDAESGRVCPGMIFFLGPPRLPWDFGTLRFMLRNFPGAGIPEDQIPPYVQGPARFAFVPERTHQLAAVEALYPGGDIIELKSRDGRLLMVIYDWPG